MRYEISLRRAAQKQLDGLPDRDYGAVARSIDMLQDDPRPPHVKKPADNGLCRIRVGRYRVVCAIDDGARLVIIVRVAKRSQNTYKGL